MWSLHKKKEGEGLFDYSVENLPPLLFSNGKTQADIVQEILKAIAEGHKIIFIKGKCGTGKSAIALNLARHFKKTAVVVPIKSLQSQYEEDYTNKKFIMKENKKLKISVIKGRNNFSCPFGGCNADDAEIPCKIEIREKNREKLNEYAKSNELDPSNFQTISDIKRFSVAPACSYWSPLLPAKIKSRALEEAEKKKYLSVSGSEYALFQRKKGCGYYDQYENYIDADVLIFNSQKYLLEMLMGRKPKTDLDIIDECDEFLDNLAQEKRINLNRLLSALSNLPFTQETKPAIQSIIFLINELIMNYNQKDVEKLKDTELSALIDLIIENPNIAEDEEENYYNKVLEIVQEFQDFLPETYVSFKKEKSDFFGEKEKEYAYIDLVTVNLSKKLSFIKERSNVLILMSGTLHSESVLRDIFGLQDFKVIDAEIQSPGTILKVRTGLEKNCKFENFRSGLVSRKAYLLALSKCVEVAKKPILIHVTAFSDLPNESEKAELGIHNLISREKLAMLQQSNREFERFKRGEVDLLFTTKCSRGVDFPGEQCNSIILTRFPYPDIQSLFWKILKKEKPNEFMKFYTDKASRDLLQKIYRGVRFKGDHVALLSPDSRVLDAKIE